MTVGSAAPSLAVVGRPAGELVVATGGDVWSFLDGLLSADLSGLVDGTGAHTLLLTPQGKLDVDLRCYRVGDDAWMVAETGHGPRLVESLNRFRIRVDAELEHRRDHAVVTVVGRDLATSFATLDAPLPEEVHAHAPWSGTRVAREDLGEVPGALVMGPADAVSAVTQRVREAGGADLDGEAAERLRIEAGVPRQGDDLDDRVIPQEALLERDAISLSKGCFLGQELVARIDSRGHVNRLLRRLRSSAPVPVGATVHTPEREVGTVTSAVADGTDAGGGVALALVRREVEPGAEVEVTWSGTSTTASVEAIDT